MDWLIKIMIYLGSALMVVNIIRFFLYARKLKRIERVRLQGWLLYVPLVLLVCFLAGYLAVGFFGDPDLVMSGILFGGSVYVFLFLLVTYRITDHIIESETALKVHYDELRSEVDSMTKTAFSVFLANLTKDLVESAEGTDLYEGEREMTSFSALIAERRSHILYRHEGNGPGIADLIRSFREGHESFQEVLLTRRGDGRICFVRVQVAMAEQPGTGDIIAFLTENSYDSEMVERTILDGALSRQYDLIALVANGQYRVVTENEGSGVRPSGAEGTYESFLSDALFPALKPDGSAEGIRAELDLESVCRQLSEHKTYEVNAVLETDGETRFKHISFYPVNAGERFFIMLISDTTDIHRERTEQNLRLEKALEEARRADAAKTRFFSTMSHDLRTPMNAIIGFTGFAAKCEDPALIRDYIAKIDTAGQQMLDIINDVLDMSRIESGKTPLNLKRTDLVDQMGILHDLFAGITAEKELLFSVDTSGIRDRTVRCDVKLLDRVLTNLLSNACKYTPKGGSVALTAAQNGRNGDLSEYEFRVADTGIGISPEFAEVIFTPFERGETVSEIQGTGLGMAITKSMVDLMGGTIRVESEPDKGSTFILTLTLTVLEGEEPAPEPAADPTPDIWEGHSRRVLVVDDNIINREIARLTLEDSGFTVEEAENGKEALDRISASEDGYFDLLLTDIQMPVMNGYECARAVRGLDGRKASLPILALTAGAFEGDIPEEARDYIDGVVLKPFNPDQLLAEIMRVLS